MRTPTTQALWFAYIGRTFLIMTIALVLIAVGAYMLQPFDAGIARGTLYGGTAGFIANLIHTLRTNRFLATSTSLDKQTVTLRLQGYSFSKGRFRPHQRQIDLTRVYKVEFIPKKLGESADTLRFIDKQGTAETIKVVPGYFSASNTQEINTYIPNMIPAVG